jgi:hypothetical protein
MDRWCWYLEQVELGRLPSLDEDPRTLAVQVVLGRGADESLSPLDRISKQ